jgi:hypothetical protein
MKIIWIIFLAFACTVPKNVTGHGRKIVENIIDSLQGSRETIFRSEDSTTVKIILKNEMNECFPEFRIYQAELTSVLGYHVVVDNCLILTNEQDDILQIQKPFYWNGINNEFWESIKTFSNHNFDFARSFELIQNLIIYFDEIRIDHDIIKEGRNVLFEKSVVNENQLQSKCYLKEFDEESPWGYKFTLFFILTATKENEFKIKIIE